MTTEVGIEDIKGIEDIEENMVTVVVEVVEEIGSRDGGHQDIGWCGGCGQGFHEL